MTLSIVDTEESPDPDRLKLLPSKLGWNVSRVLERGKPMYALAPARLFKRNGFDVELFRGHDEPVLPRISQALGMLEARGVSSLLDGLERSLRIAIKFLDSDTPDLTIDRDMVKRLANAELTYDLDLYLWNRPDLPNAE